MYCLSLYFFILQGESCFSPKTKKKEVEYRFKEETLAEGANYANCSSDLDKVMSFLKHAIEIAKEEGDRAKEGWAYGNLGLVYDLSKNFPRAIECRKLQLSIAEEMKNLAQEILACANLGHVYFSSGDPKTAIYYYERLLKSAETLEERDLKRVAYEGLGKAYYKNKDFKKSLECHKLLANDHYRLGNFQKTIDCYRLYLQISKDVGDKENEKQAYCYLGQAYQCIGNVRKAIECHELHLTFATELNDRVGQVLAYNNLGNDYQCIREYKKAIKYQENCLKVFINEEIGEQHRNILCSAYSCLGNAYGLLGFFNQALDYCQRCLEISTELGNREGQASAYSGLGSSYVHLGNFQKAVECHKSELKLVAKLGNQKNEGQANSNLAVAYFHLRDFEKAIHCLERQLKVAKEVGDAEGEQRAYSLLGNCYYDLGDLQIAIEYHNRSLKLAKRIEDSIGIGIAYGNLGFVYNDLGDPKKAKECHEKHLKITQQVGDRVGEAKAYFGLGRSFESTGSLQESRECYQSSVNIFNGVRASIYLKDALKITFRHMYKRAYTRLWLLLLKQGKVTEALLAANQGRAQALRDLMKLNYSLAKPFTNVHTRSLEETILQASSTIPSNVAFTAVYGGQVISWVTREGPKLSLTIRIKKISDGFSPGNAESYLSSLTESVRTDIGVRICVKCEDRSLKRLGDSEWIDTDQSQARSMARKVNPLKILYDIAVSPIADLIGSDELIIVPDGPLWLVPYAAFMTPNSKYLCETFRIRMIPSLDCLKILADCPVGYHRETGALLVGDPCVQEVVLRGRRRLQQLPCAEKEVKMIGKITNTIPLTGTEATKTQVLKSLSSVSLVHFAAHGCMETGEIVLAPNPIRSSPIPTEDDFLLTMTDVLNVKIRAKLVVLSCCHSGRGEVKAEGVVGIARAFLGAGARSVLVSLWAIDDEATLEFMKNFYKFLVEGRSASEALNRTMNYMRESEQFSELRLWAPFILIGDDVSLNLAGRYVVADNLVETTRRYGAYTSASWLLDQFYGAKLPLSSLPSFFRTVEESTSGS